MVAARQPRPSPPTPAATGGRVETRGQRPQLPRPARRLQGLFTLLALGGRGSCVLAEEVLFKGKRTTREL